MSAETDEELLTRLALLRIRSEIADHAYRYGIGDACDFYGLTRYRVRKFMAFRGYGRSVGEDSE